MTAQAPELAAVVARLEKVERQNRRLRGAGITVLVLAAAGLLMGQATPTARSVEAERFVVKDGKGHERARLAMGREGPELALYDETGKLLAGLAVGEDASGLDLYDTTGKFRVGLNVNKAGPVLVLLDEKGNTIWKQP